NQKEIQAQMELLWAPIEFDGLIKAGVLTKKSAWYILRSWAELPRHAQVQVMASKTHTGPKEPGVLMIRFRRGVKST
ncbi:MAG: hypothetical protein PVI28_19405, partial [Gammaproteobacteria bacterium]